MYTVLCNVMSTHNIAYIGVFVVECEMVLSFWHVTCVTPCALWLVAAMKTVFQASVGRTVPAVVSRVSLRLIVEVVTFGFQ